MQSRSVVTVSRMLASAIALVACSADSSPAQLGARTPAKDTGTDPAGPPRPMTRSSLSRDTAPNVTDAEKTAFSNANAALTTSLYAELRAKSLVTTDANFAFSPTSIATALSMTYAGARGATASQMEKALGFSLARDRIYKTFNWSALELASRAPEALAAAKASGGTPKDEDFRLHVINSLWADKSMQLESPFLDTLAVDYGSGVTPADFVADPTKERLAINDWVASETRKKIENLLPDGSITTDTRVVLVNAVHLKLPWLAPMSLENSNAPFRLGKGGDVQTRFVGASGTYRYAETSSAEAVEIPLQGNRVQFLLIVPKSSLEDFEAALDGNLAALRTALATPSGDVRVSLPKFAFTTDSLSLKEPLKALGMVDAFESRADFSGMTRSAALAIQDVVHKAMVGLDEHGVEAAAATAVIVGIDSVPTIARTVRADKPFFFAIVDQGTNTVLFAGHVADPTR